METCIKKCDPATEYFFKEGCYITELSNSDDDKELSVAQARVERGVTTKWHFLKDTIERYVILEGVGSVEIGELEAEEVNMGDVVIIPAGTQQRISNIGDTDLIFLAICSPPFESSNYVDI